MPSRRVTLADIARSAGVSRTAASYGLRDLPHIAPATRARIQRAARTLGYRPDPVLAKLMAHLHGARRTRYSGKLAFLNPHSERDFPSRTPAVRMFRDSAVARAAELGYEMEEFWLNEPGRSPRRLAQMLRARGIEGIVLGSTGRHGSVIDFPWGNFAAVTVGYSVEVPRLHRVATHHYRNTRLALREVAALGWRRVGLLVEQDLEQAMEDQHIAAFLAHQRDLPPALHIPVHFNAFTRGWEARLRRWFEKHRPEVVLSSGPGVEHLLAAGIRAPEDAAFASLLLWSPEDRRLAGVLPGFERLGAVAINLLVPQLQRDDFGIPVDSKIVQIDGRWRGGETLPPAPRRPKR